MKRFKMRDRRNVNHSAYVLSIVLPATLASVAVAADDESCLTLSGIPADVYARCIAVELADAIDRNGQATKETLREISDQCFVQSVQTQADWVK